MGKVTDYKPRGYADEYADVFAAKPDDERDPHATHVVGSTMPLPTRCREGGGCRQGREVCRTPLACQVSDEDGGDELGVFRGLAVAIGATALTIAIGWGLSSCMP